MPTNIALKPRYIDDLLKAAELRKRDYILAQERKVQREREAEGDEFEDKEKFVTSAYVTFFFTNFNKLYIKLLSLLIDIKNNKRN